MRRSLSARGECVWLPVVWGAGHREVDTPQIPLGRSERKAGEVPVALSRGFGGRDDRRRGWILWDSLGGMANAFLLATATALVVAWPLRLLGRWLQRKGRDLERNRKDASRR
jgi:hypothetical protein